MISNEATSEHTRTDDFNFSSSQCFIFLRKTSHSFNKYYTPGSGLYKQRKSWHNALAIIMHKESAEIFLFTEKAVWNYKWEIWQIIISFSATESLLWSLWSNMPQPHDLLIWPHHWHSLSILPFQCSSLPLILPGLPWVVSCQISLISVSLHRLPSRETPINCALTCIWQLY